MIFSEYSGRFGIRIDPNRFFDFCENLIHELGRQTSSFLSDAQIAEDPLRSPPLEGAQGHDLRTFTNRIQTVETFGIP